MLDYGLADNGNNGGSIFGYSTDASLYNVSAGQPVATVSKPTSLSYGNSFPTVTTPVSSVPLSYGGSYGSGGDSTFITKASDFLKTATMFTGSGGTRTAAASGPAGAPMTIGSANNGLPQTVAGNIDGGSGSMSSLAQLAQGIFAGMGSSGDGDVVPVSYTTSGQGGGSIDPWMIAAVLAVGAGLVYWASQ